MFMWSFLNRCSDFLFLFFAIRKKQIQMASLKADEGSALLKMRQFIWMPSYDLRTSNLSPDFLQSLQYNIESMSSVPCHQLQKCLKPYWQYPHRVATKHYFESTVPKADHPSMFGRSFHKKCRNFPSKFTLAIALFCFSARGLCITLL